jgi:hypothetical protein
MRDKVTSEQSFVKRQSQWDVFHAWEASRPVANMSLEQRVAWYAAAARLAASSGTLLAEFDRARRVRQLRTIRERLAHLHG